LTWLPNARRVAQIAAEEVEQLSPRKVLAEAAATFLPQQSFNRTRTALLRAAGVRIGSHSLVLGPVRITGIGDPCPLLHIGEHTIITGPLHADLGAPIHIGDWVRLGHDVSLLTINHHIGGEWLRSGTSFFGPIEIGDGAWIASRVTVLPGVSIGTSSVVAAGSIVTRNVPPNTLVAGVPARVVRTLEEDGARRQGSLSEAMDEPPDSMHFGRPAGRQAG
jgi:acetyltransferase-like isoleucine patch superfamily enzyme